MPDEPITPVADAPAGEPAPVTPGVPLDPNASVNQPPAAPPVTGEFHNVIGPDGALLDGFKDQLPENLRHEPALDNVATISDAFTQLINAQKMTGRDKISIPGENAQPEEVDAFQIKLGRPVTKDEYKLNVPEGFEDRFDAEGSKDLAFMAGLSQETLDKVMVIRSQEIAAEDAAEEAAEKAEYEAAEKIVVAQAGEALDEQRHLANKLIANNVPDKTPMPDGTTISGEQYQEKLLEALNDNSLRPYVFNLLANIQRSVFGQHNGPPTGAEPGNGAMTPSMLQAKADELTLTAGYTNGEMRNSNPAGYKRLTAEITDLYDRISKSEKAAG